MEFVDPKIIEMIDKKIASYEMALPRKNAIKSISGKVTPLVEHIVRCVAYRDLDRIYKKFTRERVTEETLRYWRDREIPNYLAQINEVEVKDLVKLKASQYKELLLQKDTLGENPQDYKSFAGTFVAKHLDQYGSVILTKEDGELFFRCYQLLVATVCPIFASKNSMTFEDFKPVVQQVFQKVDLVF